MSLLVGAALLFVGCETDDNGGNGGGGDALGSHLQITINEKMITSTSAVIYVTPEDNTTPYWFGVAPKNEVEAAGGATLMISKILGNNPLAGAYKGTQGGTIMGLMPSTDYLAMAVCVDKYGMTADVECVEFRTLDPTPGEDVKVSPIAAMLDYYGDSYKNGCNNYYLQLGGRKNGTDVEVLIIDLLASGTAATAAGTYTVGGTLSAGTAIAGSMMNGYQYGSYYALFDKDGNTKRFSLITSGTVSVAVDGDTYTIDCDVEDINGTKITADYEGVVEYSDKTNTTASKKASIHTFNMTRASFQR